MRKEKGLFFLPLFAFEGRDMKTINIIIIVFLFLIDIIITPLFLIHSFPPLPKPGLPEIGVVEGEKEDQGLGTDPIDVPLCIYFTFMTFYLFIVIYNLPHISPCLALPSTYDDTLIYYTILMTLFT